MDEIEDVVADKESVEADDLDKLTYMHQVQLTPPSGMSTLQCTSNSHWIRISTDTYLQRFAIAQYTLSTH